MFSINALAGIAAQVGNPSRSAMLEQLLDGRALTASELARAAGVTPQTASGHLASLAEAGLLQASSRGRHRYFRLASPAVAGLLQALFEVADGARDERRVRTGPADARLLELRTCYDHLAGRLAVALTDALVARGFVDLGEDGGLLTPAGARFFAELGLDPQVVRPDGSPRSAPVREADLVRETDLICKTCLDWSERRPHLAGRLGAAFLRRCLEADWVRRRPGSRALDVTPAGRRVFDAILRLPDAAPSEAMEGAAPEPAARTAGTEAACALTSRT